MNCNKDTPNSGKYKKSTLFSCFTSSTFPFNLPYSSDFPVKQSHFHRPESFHLSKRRFSSISPINQFVVFFINL